MILSMSRDSEQLSEKISKASPRQLESNGDFSFHQLIFAGGSLFYSGSLLYKSKSQRRAMPIRLSGYCLMAEYIIIHGTKLGSHG